MKNLLLVLELIVITPSASKVENNVQACTLEVILTVKHPRKFVRIFLSSYFVKDWKLGMLSDFRSILILNSLSDVNIVDLIKLKIFADDSLTL